MAMDGGEKAGVVTALVRSSFLVNAAYAESGRECGLTPQQGQLLCALMTQPYGMSELGALLGLARSSLTGLVDRTTRYGLVRREPDPRDGRAVRVALTDEGAALAEDFRAATCRRIEELSAGLGAAECATLAELLGRLLHDNAGRDNAGRAANRNSS
ncbi:MarR family winged helix-turn-helix transcriptional regulator [Streptomyces sp. NPDC058067]|uniref:MarR family winged helix-turn-helix transcriptional regulator n=1 Tax=Streptomyces sp. NPDC058067 TaxID=3346324 RepID=UPI0036E68843